MNDRVSPNKKLFGLKVPLLVIIVCIVYVLALLTFFLLIGLLPRTTNVIVPTNAPTFVVPTNVPTNAPTFVVPTNVPTNVPTPVVPTNAPTLPPNDTRCICNTLQPYDNFTHPLHTNESGAVFNFLNNAPFTVWVSISMKATSETQLYSNNAYQNGNIYVFLDAYPLTSNTFYSHVFHSYLLAQGYFPGRVLIYYKDPRTFNSSRPLSGYNVSTLGNINPNFGSMGELIEPTIDYAQLIEFNLRPTAIGNPISVDYDISYVDNAALPVYVYGGYDTTNIPQPSCNKVYSACPTLDIMYEGCPTVLINHDTITNGSQCLGSYVYCALEAYKNTPYCHLFDDIALCFGINQTFLDYLKQSDITSITNPTNVIYGCNGEFLFENSCLNVTPYIHIRGVSSLTRSQCASLNRGTCFAPNCSFPTPINSNNCPYQVPEISTCNSETHPFYQLPLLNQYTKYIRSKGEKFYGFSQDEGDNGGNQLCDSSAQLDIVVFPSCLN
jgi:hypothetical protein